MDEHASRTVERHCDVAVIGGSAAGLAAALQLARQRRSVIVVDDGRPRNAPAAHMHSYLGHEGLPPGELVAIGRAEVRSYGGEVLTGTATGVHRTSDGRLRVELSGGHALVARRVLAASGLVDGLPPIEGLAERWGSTVISCPFCHGYEVRDQRVVQIVTHPRGLHTAPLYRSLSAHLVVVLHGEVELDDGELDLLRAGGVEVVRDLVLGLVDGGDGGDGTTTVELRSGARLDADAVVVAPSFRVRAEPLAPLGIATVPHPSGLGEVLAVDATGETAVAGVYAAGNVVDPSLQVLPAAADGSRVGAMIAFRLAEDDLRAAARPSATERDWDERYGGGAPIWSGNPNGSLVHEVAGLAPGRALDVGAGEGGDAIWLAEQGWQVTASDISARALSRVSAEADRRGLPVECRHRDANDPRGFEATFDLVSLQYGAIPRTPDQRGVRNLLEAVAPGGTLLVVAHDLAPMRVPVDPAVQTRMFDPDAYIGVDELAAAVAERPGWTVEVHDTRPRPAGAVSAHHVDDVVLRCRRTA